MKKYLLTLALAAVAFGASAETYVLYDKDSDKGTWTADGTGFKMEKKFGDVTITVNTDKGSSTTALQDPSNEKWVSWRVYKNSSFSINSSVDLKTVAIEFDTYEYQGQGYIAEMTLSDGWTGKLETPNYTITSAGLKTFTATSSNQQVRIAKLSVSTDETLTPPVEQDGVIYSNNFSSNLDGWNNVAESEKEWDGWYINNTMGCAVVSSYSKDNGNFPGKATLSKEFDFTGYTNVKLTVEQAFGFFFPTENVDAFTLNVRKAGEEEWSKLMFSVFPPKKETGNWTDFAANEFDLSEFDGEKIELAFVYDNTDGASKSWELKNFKLEGDKKGAVSTISVDENAPAVYYNLMGARVANPENGIFVCVKGGKAVKVVK